MRFARCPGDCGQRRAVVPTDDGWVLRLHYTETRAEVLAREGDLSEREQCSGSGRSVDEDDTVPIGSPAA